MRPSAMPRRVPAESASPASRPLGVRVRGGAVFAGCAAQEVLDVGEDFLGLQFAAGLRAQQLSVDALFEELHVFGDFAVLRGGLVKLRIEGGGPGRADGQTCSRRSGGRR